MALNLLGGGGEVVRVHLSYTSEITVLEEKLDFSCLHMSFPFFRCEIRDLRWVVSKIPSISLFLRDQF